MKTLNMHTITYSDMQVIRRWRTFLYRLGLVSAMSWDMEASWEVSDEL